MRAASCLNVSLRCSGSRTSRLEPRPYPTLTLPDERMLLNEILVLYSVLYFRFSAQVHFACAHDSACKGTKNFWNVQIYLLHFNKKSSTAVPSRNAQSPWEQIVRSEAKIRMVLRKVEITKHYCPIKIGNCSLNLL